MSIHFNQQHYGNHIFSSKDQVTNCTVHSDIMTFDKNLTIYLNIKYYVLSAVKIKAASKTLTKLKYFSHMAGCINSLDYSLKLVIFKSGPNFLKSLTLKARWV